MHRFIDESTNRQTWRQGSIVAISAYRSLNFTAPPGAGQRFIMRRFTVQLHNRAVGLAAIAAPRTVNPSPLPRGDQLHAAN
jgi:hypothetical protein